MCLQFLHDENPIKHYVRAQYDRNKGCERVRMRRGLNVHVGQARGSFSLPRCLTRHAETPPRTTSYGAFVRCNSAHNGDDLAVKVVCGSRTATRSIDEIMVANEVLAASEETPHPNLVARYPASDRFPAAPGTLVSITRWLNGGTLLSVLEDACSAREYMPLQDVLRYTMDVVSGVAHLHTRLRFAHLDISPETLRCTLPAAVMRHMQLWWTSVAPWPLATTAYRL